jgi:hypothetical protein
MHQLNARQRAQCRRHPREDRALDLRGSDVGGDLEGVVRNLVDGVAHDLGERVGGRRELSARAVDRAVHRL